MQLSLSNRLWKTPAATARKDLDKILKIILLKTSEMCGSKEYQMNYNPEEKKQFSSRGHLLIMDMDGRSEQSQPEGLCSGGEGKPTNFLTGTRDGTKKFKDSSGLKSMARFL